MAVVPKNCGIWMPYMEVTVGCFVLMLNLQWSLFAATGYILTVDLGWAI
jgi:hypothetical protein